MNTPIYSQLAAEMEPGTGGLSFWPDWWLEFVAREVLADLWLTLVGSPAPAEALAGIW